jgi:hypothetical protein
MNRHADLATLEDLEGCYGPRYTRGILIDALPKAQAAGLVVVSGAHADYVASRNVTHRAVKVLCGHLVEWLDEDGRRDGRCGQPIVPGGNGCPAHDLDMDTQCEHGLSASLCAGPGHYPMDR